MIDGLRKGDDHYQALLQNRGLAALFADANAQPIVTAPCPSGDGRSAPRVAAILEEMLAGYDTGADATRRTPTSSS